MSETNQVIAGKSEIVNNTKPVHFQATNKKLAPCEF